MNTTVDLPAFDGKVLPNECVDAIWAHLWPSDLQAAMRVSSAWARSAATVLYRDIHIDNPARLRSLLRTVQRRPDLAAYVRRLKLYESVMPDPHGTRSLSGSAPSLLQHLPALQQLHLMGGWRGGVDLILEHAPVLKSLQYEHWCDVNDRRSLQDCDELNHGLRSLEHTLEHLHVHLELYSHDAEEVEDLRIVPVNGHLSLSRFTNLRTLRVPVALLLGWTPQLAPELDQVLPASLRSLSLTEDLVKQSTYQWSEDALLAKLHGFLTGLDERTHSLELVEFHLSQLWGDRWRAATTGKLEQMVTEARVRCVVDMTECYCDGDEWGSDDE
ncbi:hypothetical protein F5Y14DRAFT_272879 [Nemania sp. NC0429]|nr:hypothetical protein F5Y14DRAFT_272879 [Nemania sp. NC0429]